MAPQLEPIRTQTITRDQSTFQTIVTLGAYTPPPVPTETIIRDGAYTGTFAIPTATTTVYSNDPRPLPDWAPGVIVSVVVFIVLLGIVLACNLPIPCFHVHPANHSEKGSNSSVTGSAGSGRPRRHHHHHDRREHRHHHHHHPHDAVTPEARRAQRQARRQQREWKRYWKRYYRVYNQYAADQANTDTRRTGDFTVRYAQRSGP